MRYGKALSLQRGSLRIGSTSCFCGELSLTCGNITTLREVLHLTVKVSDRRQGGLWCVKGTSERPPSVARRSAAAVRSTDLVRLFRRHKSHPWCRHQRETPSELSLHLSELTGDFLDSSKSDSSSKGQRDLQDTLDSQAQSER